MSFTTKINISLAEKLKEDLTNQGFTFTKPPYTLFSAKKKGVTCILYESGSLVVQGKEMDSFIEFYLEPEILKTFHFSHPETHVDLTAHIGMDEAGKGDFFGPLCIAAVYADEAGIKKMLEMKVRDSKKMTDDGIVKLAKMIKGSFQYTVIRLFPLKYNELYGKFKNLNRLLGWAHASALGDLSAKSGCKEALIDQFADKHVMENALAQKKILDVNLAQKTKGEEDPVVAAASILARAAFVEGIDSLSEEMGIELPKGANSKVKIAGQKVLAKFGKEGLIKVAKMHFKTASEL